MAIVVYLGQQTWAKSQKIYEDSTKKQYNIVLVNTSGQIVKDSWNLTNSEDLDLWITIMQNGGFATEDPDLENDGSA
jgi:hypothetical protein